MKIKKIIFPAAAAILLVSALLFIWNKWFSPTKIGFVNYQVTTLGQIGKANDNPFIKLREIPLEKMNTVNRYDMVLVNAMGIRLTEDQRDELKIAALAGTPVYTSMSTRPDNLIVSVDSLVADTLSAYLSGGGRANFRSMLNLIRRDIDRKIIFRGEVKPAVPAPEGLFSHPDLSNPDGEDEYFESLDAYESFLTDNGLLKPGNKRILLSGTMGNPADLVRALEKKGFVVYRLEEGFSSFLKAVSERDDMVFCAAINLAHGRLGDEAVEWLSQQNIPLFCPLNVNMLTEDWEADPQGMQGGFLSQSVVTPELDGAIRPYVLFGQRINKDGLHEEYIIPERLDNFVQTIENYVALREKGNKDKRIAVVYLKGPGEESLTASGLDVVPSLYNFLSRLRREGYNVKGLPSSASSLQDLIQREGTPISDLAVLETSPDTVVRLQFGNIALLPQPLAAHGDNTFEIVHGSDNAPVREFQRAYEWIREDFEADALIHFGTHGGLEFTPRKQVALSASDYPEKLVGTLPHFYLYTIGNVGEALIAKRRTYAGIQSHLTAPYMESGLREEYRKLSNAIADYQRNPTDAGSLKVKRLAVGMGLHRDLGLDSLYTVPWTEDQILKVERFGEEIANEKIVGEFYTLGEPYEPARIESSVYAMATDPIAYSMLSLDKQLGRAASDEEKHPTLFNKKYRDKAKELVGKLLIRPELGNDDLVCRVAEITREQLETAREIDKTSNGPKDMMSIMMSMAAGSGLEGSEMPSDTSAVEKHSAGVDSDAVAAMKKKAEGMDPKKALAMAKKAGASTVALEKMSEAMGLGSAGSKDAVSGMMAIAASARKEYSREEKDLSRAIMEVERTILNVGTYKKQLLESPEAELSSFVNALAGGYTRPSSGGDVITNPRAIPTGCNLYGINAENTPSESAWEKGKELVNQTLRLYKEHHADSLPRKVSFTFWSSEFIETEGVSLAQAMYMLGVEPVRDVFGRVTDIRLIPSEELGRPRIDILVQTSGQFRDLAASRLYLLNRAVAMAADAGNDRYENMVHEGVIESERTLAESGVSPKDAREMSYFRIFGGLDGGYGTGIQEMVQSGESWKDESEIAETYIGNMSAFYGSEQYWEKASKAAFKAALTRTDAVIQPRQSNSWGALSLDHVYEFMGGMNLAVRNVTGKDPDAYFADYRNRNRNRMQELKEAIGVESRSTILNPNYIKEKMKGGASEAASFAEIIENTYGWNVMKPTVIDEELWEDIYRTYIEDDLDLGVDDFLKENNPAALQQMVHAMVQAIDKDLWKADPSKLQNLQTLESELEEQARIRMAERNADKREQQEGKILKKEELSPSGESKNVLVTASVVFGVVLSAAAVLYAVLRKRRKAAEEELI